MTTLSTSRTIGCPGCVAIPPGQIDAPAAAEAHLILSVPTIQCQSCIARIEEGLNSSPGIRSARVNLTRKRVVVEAEPQISAEDVAAKMRDLGFDAHELDPAALHDTQTQSASRDLLMRLAVAGFATMNVMLLSVAVWSGATDATRDLFHWISAAIALPALAFSAQPFFRNAWSALRAGKLNMDVPISLAIALAVATSLWETWLSGSHAYFDAALTLTFFLLAGRWLEARARFAARSAAEELTALEVPRAWIMRHGGPVEVPASLVAVGSQVLLKPGGRAPVDGLVINGMSEVDRAALTGETLPVARGPGDMISAGEVNLTGPLTLQATAVGSDTSLQRLAALVAIAESGRSRYTSLADAAAKLYAPGVHILAALAFLGWLFWSGDFRVAVNIAAAVLIITCPCALGLAVPAVTTAASGLLFRKGLLIKNATALERLSEVDTVVFDKTGTLTLGAPQLDNWDELDSQQRAIACALAQSSAHPLARSIAEKARATGVVAVPLDACSEKPGFGTQGLLSGIPVRLGRPDWLGLNDTHHGLSAALDVGSGSAILLRFKDRVRPGSAELIEALNKRGVHTLVLSGDRAGPVSVLAQNLGLSQWEANLLPEQKVERILALQDAGKKVLMIGDGLNDTGALAVANVSISPAQALDAARAASDIVLLGDNLAPISQALTTARLATQRIKQNFRIATLYNIIAVPLAVAGLATPLVAALAMSSSSLTVSLNALRVRSRQ